MHWKNAKNKAHKRFAFVEFVLWEETASKQAARKAGLFVSSTTEEREGGAEEEGGGGRESRVT